MNYLVLSRERSPSRELVRALEKHSLKESFFISREGLDSQKGHHQQLARVGL